VPRRRRKQAAETAGEFVKKGSVPIRWIGNEDVAEAVKHVVKAKGSVLLLGDIGTGKTAMVKHILLHELGLGKDEILYMTMTRGIKPTDLRGVDLAALMRGEEKAVTIFGDKEAAGRYKAFIMDEIGRGHPHTTDDAVSKLLEERKIIFPTRSGVATFELPDLAIILIGNPVGTEGVEGIYAHTQNRVDYMGVVRPVRDWFGQLQIAQVVMSRDLAPDVAVETRVCYLLVDLLHNWPEEARKLGVMTATPRFFEKAVKRLFNVMGGEITLGRRLFKDRGTRKFHENLLAGFLLSSSIVNPTASAVTSPAQLYGTALSFVRKTVQFHLESDLGSWQERFLAAKSPGELGELVKVARRLPVSMRKALTPSLVAAQWRLVQEMGLAEALEPLHLDVESPDYAWLFEQCVEWAETRELTEGAVEAMRKWLNSMASFLPADLRQSGSRKVESLEEMAAARASRRSRMRAGGAEGVVPEVLT